jgi:putative nucleotidyltransferase with HDIG domain
MSAVASLARSVADRAGVARDEAFLAGLLHDTGLVLLQIRPDAAGHADDVHEPADRLHHSEIGSAALRAWGLPETLNDAIARHHEPAWLGAGAPRSLTSVIAVADALACIAARPVRAQAPAPAQATGRQEVVASASNVADVAPGSRVDAEWPAWVADDIPALLEVAREAVGRRGDQPGSPVR